ncbi:hypothetical protein PENSPDRAFT_421177 [Peniophora sp. CONT]|nr:hypothetical protein PENSPDRAFT_421177 [Peniophora sp. CONT]
MPSSPDSVDDLSYHPLACDDRTRDAVRTIVSGRKSWKTLKGKGEAVWPPYLEAALVEALDKYRPESSRSTRSLSRFPNRNRFISDYIYHVTGKRRTAKQVGSRLQQLRDTCGGKRILKLLSSRDYSDDEGISPTASLPPTLNSFKPSRALVTIDVLRADAPWPSTLPDNNNPMLSPPLSPTATTPASAIASSLAPLPVSSPSGGGLQASVSTFRSPFARPLRVIDPTVTFTSAALVRANSACAVYFNGNCVHRESTCMQVSQTPDNLGYVYRVALVPGFWQKLCESNDPGRYSIVQEIIQSAMNSSPLNSPSLSAEIPPSASVLLTVVYQLQEPAGAFYETHSRSVSPETSPSPTPAPSQTQMQTHAVDFGHSLSSLCDTSGYFPPQLPISPVSATFSDVPAPSHQPTAPIVQQYVPAASSSAYGSTTYQYTPYGGYGTPHHQQQPHMALPIVPAVPHPGQPAQSYDQFDATAALASWYTPTGHQGYL